MRGGRMACECLGLRWVRGEGTHRFRAQDIHPIYRSLRACQSGVSPIPRQPPQSKILSAIRTSRDQPGVATFPPLVVTMQFRILIPPITAEKKVGQRRLTNS